MNQALENYSKHHSVYQSGYDEIWQNRFHRPLYTGHNMTKMGPTLHKFNFIAADCNFAIVAKVLCRLRESRSTNNAF